MRITTKRLMMAGLIGTTALTMLPASAAAQAATADTTAKADGGDIVVTARRREESLQDVPVAVSAFSAASLDRQQIDNVVDLSLAVPNMLVTQTGGSANAVQIFIRGFGQDALGFNSETPIGVYFDDVFLGRVQGGLLDIGDLERVEVLRGPQGTLYGRNSTTGAVKFVPRAPDLEDLRLAGEVTLGSYHRTDGRVTVSIPLMANTLAMKVDLSSRNVDGYIRGVDANGALNKLRSGGVDRDAARIALRWQASDATMVDASFDIGRDRSDVLNSTKVTCPNGPNGAGCVPTFGIYRTGINFPGQQYQNSWGVSGKIAHDFGWATLKSISAYRTFEGFDPIDLRTLPGNPSPVLYTQDQEQFSQELQLVSNGDGPISYTLGLFYFHEHWKTNTNFLNLRRILDEQRANSYAAYGEISWKVIETLTITAGGRVTRDTKAIDRIIFNPIASPTPTVTASPPTYKQTVFTPKIGLQWQPSEEINAYLTYSQGYRPGGFSETWPGTAIGASATLEAEKIRSYEAGIKLSGFDGRATLNLAAYQSDYKNLQQGQLTATSFNILTSDVRVRGLEAEARVAISSAFSLYGNLGLLDDKVKRSNIPNDNLSRRLRYAPKFSYKVGASLVTPMSDSLDLFSDASIAGVGRTPIDQANTLVLFMPSYELIDAQIGLRTSDGKYSVAISGKNLTDKAYWRSGIPSAGLEGRFYAPPRTFAITLAARY